LAAVTQEKRIGGCAADSATEFGNQHALGIEDTMLKSPQHTGVFKIDDVIVVTLDNKTRLIPKLTAGGRNARNRLQTSLGQ